MPGFLELESGPGFLTLSGGNGLLLLSESDPVAPNEAQLYETDRIEQAFKLILQSHLPTGCECYAKRESKMDQTPRVDLVLTIQQNNTRRYLRFPTNSFSPAQLLNSWNFQLQATVVTNRMNSNLNHNTIVGIVRWNLQYCQLLNTWDASVAPYHAITSIGEAQTDNTVESDGDLDMQRLTFSGICNIRDSAWPEL